MNSKQRKEHLLNTAINIALKKGYSNILRKDVAKTAHVAPTLINYYFKNIENFKKEIVETAIKRGIVNIIAQAIILDTNKLLKLELSSELKKEITDLIVK